MSYAKSLKGALKDKNETLFNRLQPIEDAAKSVLTYTASKFPYYTPHDFLHSRNVEEILNWLIPDDVKNAMVDYEIFFLIVAAWLHDWGMVGAEHEDSVMVRNLHHIRTQENFEKLHDKVGLSLAEGRVVGRICRGHRQDDLLASDYDDTFYGSNVLIKLRFLAALLRMADECDVTANRTPEVVYYSLKPEGASGEEYQKHLSISGIGKPSSYKLLLSGVAKTPRGVEVIEGVKNRIQNQLNSVKGILSRYGVALDIIETDIYTRGFINKPIAFELDRKTIVRLLIGTALYSRDDVAIREVLQNAVDSCRLRKLMEGSLEPSIEIEFHDNEISFEDDGIGMNFADASNYFAKKGNSFFTSTDFMELLKNREFDPISKFGIGVLSSFIIADKMIVETKKDNCAPCRFTITDLAEGWIYEEGSRQETGTKITLLLNEKGKKIDVEKALKHYAKNVTIPILIKDPKTGEKRELLQDWSFDSEEILQEVRPDERQRFSQTRPELTLKKTSSGLESTFHIFNEQYFGSKNCFLLKNGIYVGNFEFFPCISPFWIALIDCKSDIVDLKVSREDLQKGEKYLTFLSAVYDDLMEALSVQVRKRASDSKLKECIGFSALSHSLFEHYFGGYQDEPESLWLEKFNKNRIFPVLLKSGLGFLSGEEILSKRFSKIIHYVIPFESPELLVAVSADVLLPKMKENEAIVFDHGPRLLAIRREDHKFLCSFCELLKSNGMSETECYRLNEIMSLWNFEKVSTTIDCLLPDSSFFTHMPECFRSLTPQIRGFQFSPPIETIEPGISDSLLDSVYQRLVARELFKDDKEIAAIYDSHILMKCKGTKPSIAGQFAYDAEDPFLKYIISKTDCVLSDQKIRKMVQRYLRSLAVFYLAPVISRGQQKGRLPDSAGFQAILEKSIAEILEYPEELPPLWKRMGKLSWAYISEV
jgi:hypothetical protein